MASNLYIGPITDSTLTLSYSLDPRENLKDKYGRFLPQTRLIRVQAEDSSDDTDIDTVTDLFRRSEIESFKNCRYSDGDTDLSGTPNVTTANNYIQRRPPSTQRFSLLTKTYNMSSTVADYGPNWCDLGSGAGSASSNGKIGNTFDILGGSYPITNSTNTLESAPTTFVFLAKNQLFDRIHFRTRFNNVTSIGTPVPDNADDPAGSNFPAVEMQVFYAAFKDFTKTNIIWKPLKYNDGTTFNKRRGTSLYHSGIISWDIPEDWIKTKHYYNGSPTAAAPTVDYSFGTKFDYDNSVGVQERWRCQCGTGDPNDYEGDYLILHDTADATVGVWIDHDGDDTVPGGVSGTTTQLKVNIADQTVSGTDDAIAEHIKEGINTLANFSATRTSDKVYITCTGPMEYGATANFTSSDNNNLKMVNSGSDTTQTGTDGAAGTKGPRAAWLKDSYALVIAFAADATSITATERDKWRIHAMRPFTNSHSQAVEVKDPTHLSLNHFAVAQSISFTRRGKFQKIESRLGTTEIRKIGAEGGQITFGGIDLISDPNTMRATMYEYQRDSVPVYIDVSQANSAFTRFFGVITQMSEDHPTGKMHPKFALTLLISKIGEFGSDGKILSEGLVSLGGEVEERSDFISFGGHKT
jgi:hypothetical protein